MDYRNLLVNSTAYGKIGKAKELLGKRLGAPQSVSDLVMETIGRNIDLLDIDSALRAYIKAFAGTLGKNAHVLGVLLYGSVAKGIYTACSDIDLLIIVDDSQDKFKMLDAISNITDRLDGSAMSLFHRQLPSSISPLVMRAGELGRFEPIHFDFLDYGVVLYDYADTLANFLMDVHKMKHKREFTQYGEVLTWQ